MSSQTISRRSVKRLGVLGAALLAETTVVVLHVALESWLAEPTERTFGDVSDACFQRLFPTSALA